ncbi:2OG-Fe(II) oxygenase family protein [Piscinibacter koreensis]|nr:2OG-Fe(II) oxygenase family protein [Schlegelella koreensis]
MRPVPTAPLAIMELGDADFAAGIDGQPCVVVAFRTPGVAEWTAFAPTFAAAAARHPDVRFATVNVARSPALAAQFDVRATPTLMIFCSNIVVFANPGALPAEGLEQVLAGVRALDMDEVRRQVANVDPLVVGDGAVPASAPLAAPADDLAIEAHLRAPLRALLPELAARLSAGGLVAIRDAFEPEFAERMFRSLDECTAWRVHDGGEGDFHYHHHNLYDNAAFPQDLAWCSRIFDSAATKDWVTRMSGRPCPGPTEFSASWYLPGDHSLPHNDVAHSEGAFSRQVAYVWHLAKNWRPEWGGALYWCSKGCYLPPTFNTLWLFNVGPESNHFVTHVSPYARGKRLAINGWWTGAGAVGERAWKGPEHIRGDGAEIVVY